jgi:hypothetical protein
LLIQTLHLELEVGLRFEIVAQVAKCKGNIPKLELLQPPEELLAARHYADVGDTCSLLSPG